MSQPRSRIFLKTGLSLYDYHMQGPQDAQATEARRFMELAAWQAVLPSLYPEIAEERVLDVVAVSSGRILLLTDTHVAMLKVPPQVWRFYFRTRSFSIPESLSRRF